MTRAIGHRLLQLPQRVDNRGQEAPVSVVVPVLNEARTVGRLVRRLRSSPLVSEVVVIDDGSTDGTPELASRAGALVCTSSLLGKGASMEDGLRLARKDIVLFVDGDLAEIGTGLVDQMTRPLVEGRADLVKARFSREAGRVTLLTARPLLTAFFPELAGFGQPLGGIAAARRSLLQSLRLEDDYGVDIGVLIDAVLKGARVVEVDVGRIQHDSQPLEALADMAKQVARVILDRAWRYDRLSINMVRQMEETERKVRAEGLPAVARSSGGKFALFDMDGVLLDGRFVVALADRVGAQNELSRFLDSVVLPDDERTRAIASLFAGVTLDTIEETARAVPLMDGAVETVVSLRRAGYAVGIVSDSFQPAVEIVRRRVFADFALAHNLHFRNGAATGDLTPSPMMLHAEGCPRHSCCKSNVVRHLVADWAMDPTSSLAIGDGENDICLLRRVGSSFAFRPKSNAVSLAAQSTVPGSLTAILDLLGISPATPREKGDSARRSAAGILPALSEGAC